LKESLLFLSFVNGEGLGLLAVEAMSCGCVVVGYDGMGGKEFFVTLYNNQT
jgi:glycosyltransferase involved in cell wall biosynthesis